MRGPIGAVALLASAALLVPTAAAREPETGLAAGAAQIAFATWTMPPRDGVRTYYLMAAWRSAEAYTGFPEYSSAGTFAEVFKVRCESRTRGCRGRGSGRRIAVTDFTMDPAMTAATASLTAGKMVHRATWTANAAKPPRRFTWTFLASSLDDDLQFFGYGSGGALRKAEAAGTLFGRRMPTRAKRPEGVLVTAVGAMTYRVDWGCRVVAEPARDRAFLSGC